MNTLNNMYGKILYAILFLLVIPIMLWLWDEKMAQEIMWPGTWNITVGWVLISVGLFSLLWGMVSIIVYGKGLPMNAYPPVRFVQEGAYKLLNHPIYVGFAVFVLGYFTVSESLRGVWVITPLTVLAMIALVMGYENFDLKKRFPENKSEPLLRLPDAEEPVMLRDRLSSFFWIGLGVIVLNMFSNLLGALDTSFPSVHTSSLKMPDNPFDYLPFLCWVALPIVFNNASRLADWTRMSIFAFLLAAFVLFLKPSWGSYVLPQVHAGELGIPLFFIVISVYMLYRESQVKGILLLITVLGWLIALHKGNASSVISLSMGLVIGLLAINLRSLWKLMRLLCERIANSWKEWTIGNVRVINHGFYVGFGSFLGIFMSGMLAGSEYAWGILVFALIVIIFSALWAQIIEGSDKLKRPFGYYGALVGIIFASLAVWAMGLEVWIVIGVISVVMPWVQAIGRLRCLINGCCHGSPTRNPEIGIRYTHYRSRVVHLSEMKDKMLHPTPLYSILWLSAVGLVLLELWSREFSSPFIFGLYLILTGIGRFVEEAYRGEVQTPVILGLRLYQWTAIASVLIGIGMTLVSYSGPQLSTNFDWDILWSALLGGVFTFFAMAVDFPRSNLRFSRLV